ncbi:ATP-binding protein [Streptomyces sp. NPDC005925]|uniref:ATP-binding protein n=1 Tax=Streptomyces sp. NPDC005925 TaxID=3157172 RepID=UPI0033F73EC3
MELTEETLPTAHGGSPSRALTPDDVTSAATARAYAESVLRRAGDAGAGAARDEDVIDLLLVVSELVTNAIRHGGGLAGFDARVVEDGVRIAVHDRSDIVPPVAYGPGSLPPGQLGSGYGWPLIIRLAREIGVDRRPGGGKTVTVLVPVRTGSGG